MAALCSTLPYELRVGVTGHRSIPDEPATRRAVKRLLDQIAATLHEPGCAPLSWTVVSALARGADRLVADVVLERPAARLEVVTPLPADEYRRDFDSQEDLQAFNRLFDRADQVNELHAIAPGEDTGGSDPADSLTERQAAYLRAGERIVDACEMLIAFWDGRGARGVGGTADIVQYALFLERPVFWIHAERPHEPPRLIRLIHDADGAADDALAVTTDAVPGTPKKLSPGYHQQVAYCQDERLNPARYASGLAHARKALQTAARQCALPEACLEPIVGALLPEFVRADELAIVYQNRHTRAATGVLYLAGFAVTVAVAQVSFFPDVLWLIVFEVAAMAAVLGLWLYSRREAWHEKWLHDRYLAERFRTAMFTTLAGSVRQNSGRDDPLPFYRGPRQWLALAADSLGRTAARSTAPPFEPLRRFVAMAWLDEQRGFHERNDRTKTRRARRRHALGLALFAVTLVMASLHLVGVGHAAQALGARIVRLDLWVVFFAIVLPVWAGAVHAATSQLELERIAQRSARMAHVLEGLLHRLQKTTTREELRQIVLEAANLLKVENHEWWVLLSFQDVRLHA